MAQYEKYTVGKSQGSGKLYAVLFVLVVALAASLAFLETFHLEKQATAQELEQARNELDDSRNKLQQASRDIQRLENQAKLPSEEWRRQETALKAQISRLKEQNAQMDAAMQRSGQRSAEEQSQLKLALDQAQETLTQLRDEKNGDVSVQQQKLAEQLKSLQASTVKVADLEARERESTGLIADLRARLAEAETLQEGMQKQLSHYETVLLSEAGEYQRLHNAYDALNVSYSRGQSELQRTQGENALLKNENQALTEELAEDRKKQAAQEVKAREVVKAMQVQQVVAQVVTPAPKAPKNDTVALPDWQKPLDSVFTDVENAEVVKTEQGWSVRIWTDKLFHPGEVRITRDGQRTLRLVAKAMESLPQAQLIAEGHTDVYPITGPLKKIYPSNWELSSARASASLRFLQHAAEVAPERMMLAAHGPYSPIADNRQSEGRSQNRRIDFIFTPQVPNR